MNIGIVIIAAGESTRMGEPKQLLPFRGKTLLQHTIDVALSREGAPVAVVLGAHAAEIRARLEKSRVLWVENSRWPDGMGGSLRAGLAALLVAHSEISAVVFLLCDQPLLSAETLEILVATHERTGHPIVASEYDAVLGVPALFSRTLFPELLALQSDVGARQIIRAHRDLAIGVPFHDGAVDIDTPDDYARLRGEPSTSLPA